MKIFFDTEFTGLHQNTTLISLGLIAEDGQSFYAEFVDYNPEQVDTWIEENVLSNLKYLPDKISFVTWKSDSVEMVGHRNLVRGVLSKWLEKFEQVEMWGDCLAWDWVLFCELFGGAFGIPKNVYYLPFDIVTLFKMKGIDPDVNREDFIGNFAWLAGCEMKHNALWDALVIKACYKKLTKEK